MAEIGIILATYNGEKYLREQLDSILSNTFKDYEIHICDDGSTDGTIAIAKEYAEKYPLTYPKEGLSGPYLIDTIYQKTKGEAVIVTDIPLFYVLRSG